MLLVSERSKTEGVSERRVSAIFSVFTYSKSKEEKGKAIPVTGGEGS
jgi:hypothetical protein